MRVTMLALAATLLLAPATYDRDRLPYRAQWGPYRVVVETAKIDDEDRQRVQIFDASGKVLREVRDERILDVAFVELTGTGDPELYVSGYSGGSHCCGTEYYFTHDGGLRNLLIFDAINGGIGRIRDLNRDGRPELTASSDALSYFGNLHYAASPWVQMVIAWDGTRYTDQTRRYPAAARRAARKYRAEFLAALKQHGEDAEERRRGTAAGYYGNALVIGEGVGARQWLLQHAPRTTRQWLLEHEADLREAVAANKRKIRVSQQPVLEGVEFTSTAH
jgi:hypothetical protein